MAQKEKEEYTIITCSEESEKDNVKNFRPIETFEMPEYPELKLHYPPLLDMVNYCYEKGFTHIHTATPGSIGLAAVAIAHILNLPIYGTYHTSLPQYVGYLTGDSALADITWKYLLWYYNQMDVVYVPSKDTGEDLVSKGISKEKVRFYERGIDVERFHPSNRNGFLRNQYHVSEGDLKLLYVGRISKEKNLDHLLKVFKQVIEVRRGVHLVVVGNGPYLSEMKKDLRGCPVTFTGYLKGDSLSQAYASCDIFLFPSTTDTFGNVVLEAQASGLPVIVTDKGGPKENLVDGETGKIVQAKDTDGFTKVILRLIDDRDLLEIMKKMPAAMRRPALLKMRISKFGPPASIKLALKQIDHFQKLRVREKTLEESTRQGE
jgi:glycosyltransferase involved in cell wall biosynthesis